jgi:N-methylhydantoinase A
MTPFARYRLGVDVGGTHTDLMLLDTESGELLVEKVASTPKNPACGVLDGLAKYIRRGVLPSTIGFFAHGTTITTNGLLEMRGAKVGLLITKGYRAIQEVQNQARDSNLFDYLQPSSGATTRAAFLRPASMAARPEEARASSSGSARRRSTRHRRRAAMRWRPGNASCCRARAAATEIRKSAIAPLLPAISPRDT